MSPILRTRTSIEKPIIVLGMPRSGTTVIFDAIASHPGVGWFSAQINRLPRLPVVLALSRLADLDASFRKAINRSDQRRSWREKLRVGPSESYGVWRHCCGEKFLYDHLLGIEATTQERRCVRSLAAKALRYQGKQRFAAKITGPARIGYLSSIFDDALFLHVVRDGRAVVQSLMNVHFWRDSWRERQPAWKGGIPASELARWRVLGGSPLALAAIQWSVVVQRAREEAALSAPSRYAEVRYEDFAADPHGVLDEITDFLDLARSPEIHEFVQARTEIRDMNYQWAERFEAAEIEMLNELMGDGLASFGYTPDSGSRPAQARVSSPYGAGGRGV
ncbi:MAG: sulfotransferase family protein [Thermoleophilaceae bacterium]